MCFDQLGKSIGWLQISHGIWTIPFELFWFWFGLKGIRGGCGLWLIFAGFRRQLSYNNKHAMLSQNP
jgi:hypothetical protein